MLCDATNGYIIYRMQVYTGKSMDQSSCVHDFVWRQQQCLWNSTDQWTGFPKSIIRREWEDRGYYNYLSNGPLLAAAWYDRSFVYFLSTFHGGASHEETVRRTNLEGSSSDVPCLPLLPDYQQYIRGVECSDQHIG